jgi:hypothetical protein
MTKNKSNNANMFQYPQSDFNPLIVLRMSSKRFKIRKEFLQNNRTYFLPAKNSKMVLHLQIIILKKNQL